MRRPKDKTTFPGEQGRLTIRSRWTQYAIIATAEASAAQPSAVVDIDQTAAVERRLDSFEHRERIDGVIPPPDEGANNDWARLLVSAVFGYNWGLPAGVSAKHRLGATVER